MPARAFSPKPARLVALLGSSAVVVVTALTSAAPSADAARAAAIGATDWAAYEHGPAHSSAAFNDAAITTANVASLHALWSFKAAAATKAGQPGPKFDASPSVAGGIVYIGARTGVLYALNVSTGAVVWKKSLDFGSPSVCAATSASATSATKKLRIMFKRHSRTLGHVVNLSRVRDNRDVPGESEEAINALLGAIVACAVCFAVKRDSLDRIGDTNLDIGPFTQAGTSWFGIGGHLDVSLADDQSVVWAFACWRTETGWNLTRDVTLYPQEGDELIRRLPESAHPDSNHLAAALPHLIEQLLDEPPPSPER